MAVTSRQRRDFLRSLPYVKYLEEHCIANHYVPHWVDEELRKRWPVWEGTDND